MQLLTVKEACARLRISRATLYNLVKQGKLAFVKIGGERKGGLRDHYAGARGAVIALVLL